MIDKESDPGSWKDAIAHSPNLRVEAYKKEKKPKKKLDSNE